MQLKEHALFRVDKRSKENEDADSFVSACLPYNCKVDVTNTAMPQSGGHHASALMAALDNVLVAPAETRGQRVRKLKHISTQCLIDASSDPGYTHRAQTRLQVCTLRRSSLKLPRAKPCPPDHASARKLAGTLRPS